MKLTKGRFKGMTVVMADSGRVQRLAAEVDRVLRTIGFPDALVTDESRLSDFDSKMWGAEDSKDDDGLDYPALSAALGFTVNGSDLIADIAERLRGAH